MNHLILLPVILPMLAGALLLFLANADKKPKRVLSLVFVLLNLVVAWVLLNQSLDNQILVYSMSNWQSPIGIVFVLDRLSALLVLLTACLAIPALIYGIRKDAIISRNYHALFHFQLMGIQGAFLTGDLFNLFVFFEILLIASYGLLMHGGGVDRTKASLHYVILNLIGSAIFLIGIGILYGITGSLNMVAIGQQLPELDPLSQQLALVAGIILLFVFGLKAAILPINLWLANAYSSAAPSIAALFAIMTKVGIYAIMRVHGLLYFDQPAFAAIGQWLWLLALATIAMAVVGLLAARTLKRMASQLVLISIGTSLAALAQQDELLMGAMLFYLIHSTLITAALFLLADLIAEQRGSAKDFLTSAQPLKQANLLGALFMILAISLVGLPPLSGFIGKLGILQASQGLAQAHWLWILMLSAGFAALISFGRAGSTIFWRTSLQSPSSQSASKSQLFACLLLISSTVVLTLYAQAVIDFCQQAAIQAMHLPNYSFSVLGG